MLQGPGRQRRDRLCVLVHELAHLHHPHHPPGFWRTVGRAMTDYEHLRDELDEWGADVWLPKAMLGRLLVPFDLGW
ncbi:YgjP-like metallopeptidase domain-containing protein [Streptomyces sp. NPDC005202]|uniref:YgjP-like metallopeptidase domain-containing protein n=1 Tax=Streptomyces sp. NPDC005202 TaxID=3157021 RepID=UPI0033A67D0F